MEGSHSIIFFGMEELIWFFFGMVAIYLWFSLFAIPKLVNSKIYYSILMYNQLLILVKPHNAYYFSFANKLSLHLRKLSFQRIVINQNFRGINLRRSKPQKQQEKSYKYYIPKYISVTSKHWACLSVLPIYMLIQYKL